MSRVCGACGHSCNEDEAAGLLDAYLQRAQAAGATG
jgi:hypothetical protein